MDQLDLPCKHLVCKLVAGETGNGEFPEPSIIRENSKIVLSSEPYKVLHVMKFYEECRQKRVYHLINSNIRETLSAHAETFLLQANDRLMRKTYLLTKGRNLRLNASYLDAVRFLEAAAGIDFAHVSLQAMVDRELAACYAMLGWYGKCAQLANGLLKKIEENGDHSFNGRVAKSLPTPTWQGEDTYSYECWERDIFGANNSRAQSCHTSLDGRLVAARDFDAGDLVFIERPVVGYVAETKGQCNACTLKTMHTIPCPDCSAVFYCSVHCCEKDSHFHKYECNGYKMLFFPLVNGVLPLRLLVKALDILKHTLVARPPAKYPSEVEQLWHTLLLGCEMFPDFKVILEHAYDYIDLYAGDYRVQLVKARTILKYITTSGELAQDYGLCWSNACEDTRDQFIASLLLRFSTLTMLKSACFTYELAYSLTQIGTGADTPKLINPGSFSGNVNKAQSIPSLRKFESILPRNDDITEQDAAQVKSLLDMALHEIKTRHSDEGDSIQSSKGIAPLPVSSSRCHSSLQAFWNCCVEKAAIEYGQNGVDLVQKAASFYCTDYSSTFDSFQTHLTAEKRTVNQYHGMYRFSVDMLQSSIPNTGAILLNDGVVAFRALKTIKKGQTLTYALDIRGTSDDYLIVDKFSGTTVDTLRCLECRFKIGSRVGNCLCQAVGTVRTKEMNILIDYLKSLENIIANSKEESPADRVAIINLKFFSKLWKSIFSSEFNKYSFLNFQLQLRIWALRGARGFADILSISKLLTITLCIIETSYVSKYELFYCYTVHTVQYTMIILEKLVTKYRAVTKYPDFFVILLRMLDRLLEHCKRANTVIETQMQHRYLIDILALRVYLEFLRETFIAEYSTERLKSLTL